jgi:hypothetical protein
MLKLTTQFGFYELVLKYTTVRTVPKSTRKTVERGQIDTIKTQIHFPGLVQVLQ